MGTVFRVFRTGILFLGLILQATTENDISVRIGLIEGAVPANANNANDKKSDTEISFPRRRSYEEVLALGNKSGVKFPVVFSVIF